MNSLIKINDHDLQVKEFNGQRVLTFKDIDMLHDRPEGTAKRNFSENRYEEDGKTERFINGIDFFHLTFEEARSTNFVQRPNSQGLTVITESGYLMLVKSLTDDLAWKVQRELVTNYFRAKEAFKDSSMKAVALIHAEVGELIAATTKIEGRVETLENNMTIDYAQQEELREVANKTVVKILGYGTPAYKELNKKAFSSVWRDYKRIMNVNSYKNTAVVEFVKGKELLSNWKPERELELMIKGANSQVSLAMNEVAASKGDF